MTISRHRRRADMPLQTVKCPVCGTQESIPQSRIDSYRTCSAPCRDLRLAKLARRRELNEVAHAPI